MSGVTGTAAGDDEEKAERQDGERLRTEERDSLKGTTPMAGSQKREVLRPARLLCVSLRTEAVCDDFAVRAGDVKAGVPPFSNVWPLN